MLLNYKKIEALAKQHNFSMRKFCLAIGMSETGYKQMVINNSMNIKTLERISKVLNVHPCELLSDEYRLDQGEYIIRNDPEFSSVKKEVEYLKQLIEEKDKRLEIYEGGKKPKGSNRSDNH